MGKRSRKAGRLDRPAPPPGAERAKATPDPTDAFRARAAKTEAKNVEVRESLVHLAPGEYPLPLRLAIGTCIVLAISNLVFYLGGYEVEGGGNAIGGLILFEVVLIAAAVGMVKHRYWAVLGFQALLALTVLIAGLSVVVASNLWALVLCLAVIAYGGWLFWKMVRVMARIQMPEQRRRPPV